MAERNWNSGIELIRAANIALVVLGHIILIFPFDPKLNLWIIGIVPYYSVELLFVVSGFLIGRILIRAFIIKPDDDTGPKLLHFYMRRWLRTLPAYFLLLVFHAVFWSLAGYTPFNNPQVLHWQHFVFLQNYNLEASSLFPESWSLALEEWFYLLFPMALIGIRKIRNFTHQDIEKFIYSIIIGMLALRIVYVCFAEPTYDFGIRKNIFLRFDSVAFGVWCAYLSIYRPKFFVQLGGKFYVSMALMILLGLSAYFIYLTPGGLDHDFFFKTFSFTLIYASGIPILSYCYHNTIFQSNLISRISDLAYGTYITHLTIIVIGAHYAALQSSIYMFWLFFGLTLLAVFVVPPLLYRYYELPFMNLREHISLMRIKTFFSKNNINIREWL